MGTGGDGGGGGERLEDGEVSFRLSDRDRERDEKSLSIMSPFDEQEEWAKISEIMASIGTGLVRESVFVTELEKEFQTRLGTYIYQIQISERSFARVFLFFPSKQLVSFFSFFDIKITEIIRSSIEIILFECAGLSSDTSSSPIVSTSVGQWLSTLGLADYETLFINYGFDDLDFIVSIASLLYLLKVKKR